MTEVRCLCNSSYSLILVVMELCIRHIMVYPCACVLNSSQIILSLHLKKVCSLDEVIKLSVIFSHSLILDGE